MIEVLKLNKEQEEDLITLAKAFLPEYKDVTASRCLAWDSDEEIDMDEPQIGNIKLGGPYTHYIELPSVEWSNECQFIHYQSIHWYQFCSTTLCERICKNLYPWFKDAEVDLHIRTMKRKMIVSDKHPIDFIKQYLEEYINIHQGLKKLYETA